MVEDQEQEAALFVSTGLTAEAEEKNYTDWDAGSWELGDEGRDASGVTSAA